MEIGSEAETDVEADEVWDMDWTTHGTAGTDRGPVSGTNDAADFVTDVAACTIIGGQGIVSITAGTWRAAETAEAETDVEADEVWDMDWTRLGAAGPDEGPVPRTDAAAVVGTV
eukprot:9056263-Pyramimonas_sp.AAC.1